MPKQILIIDPEDGQEIIETAFSKVDWFHSSVTVEHPNYPNVEIRRIDGTAVPSQDNGLPEIRIHMYVASAGGPRTPYTHEGHTFGSAFKYVGNWGTSVACSPYGALSTAWDTIDIISGKGTTV